MRAPYLAQDEQLTSLGRFIAARLPWVERGKWPCGWVFRIYGIKPRGHFALVSIACFRFYVDAPSWVCVRFFGITLININPELSGLPGAGGLDAYRRRIAS